MNLVSALRRMFASRRGNIMTNFALMLPIIIGTLGLAVEYGAATVVRTTNQRIADAAAFAGAVAYNVTGNLSDAQSAAQKVATLNNYSGGTPSVTIVPSPADASRNAIRVSLSQTVPLGLSSFFSSAYDSQTVAANATAELISQTSNCIVALDRNSSGIELSGGTSVTGNRCGVAANARLRLANCGVYIQASSASYGTTLDVPNNCGGTLGLRKADGSALTAVQRSVADPYLGNAVVASATARLTTVAAQTAPTAPAVSVAAVGSPIAFGYNDATTIAQANTIGCTATRSGSTWTMNCPAGSTRNVGAVTISGGIAVRFNMTGTIANVLNFNGSVSGEDRLTFGPGTYNIRGNLIGGYGGITFSGNALNVTGFVNPGSSGTSSFGDGTYTINQGLFMLGSVTVTFGAGSYNIGRATIACGGSGLYSICSQTSGGVTFTGSSTFTLNSGLRTGGGATITLGSGTANSYHLGSSSDGFAFRGDGGAKTTLADATDGGLMQFVGNVNLTGGGSCLVVGAAGQHDIRGNLWGSGAMLLRTGTYTVLGTINFGGSGGGNTNCGGSNIGLSADGVTFVVGADSRISSSGGACSGNPAFCVAAGYSSVLMRPPASGNQAGFALIGPQSSTNTAGALFTSGATNSIVTGAFYLPNGAVTMSGGARTGDASGCLELIGQSVSLSGGAVLGSNCLSSGGATQIKVRLVS